MDRLFWVTLEVLDIAWLSHAFSQFDFWDEMLYHCLIDKPSFPILQAVKKGDDIFIGQYLFTGNETTSVWMEVWQTRILFNFIAFCIFWSWYSVTDCEIRDHIFHSSVQVAEVKGEDVVCRIKNSATLAGPLYTLHVAGIHIDLPTLTDKDKEAWASFIVICLHEHTQHKLTL